MAYRALDLAPGSRLPAHRRGPAAGRFCRVCGGIYPRLAARHIGKPMHGKDHVSSPCSQEGQRFVDGAEWWEPAVELRPEPVEADTGAEDSSETP